MKTPLGPFMAVCVEGVLRPWAGVARDRVLFFSFGARLRVMVRSSTCCPGIGLGLGAEEPSGEATGAPGWAGTGRSRDVAAPAAPLDLALHAGHLVVPPGSLGGTDTEAPAGSQVCPGLHCCSRTLGSWDRERGAWWEWGWRDCLGTCGPGDSVEGWGVLCPVYSASRTQGSALNQDGDVTIYPGQ